MVTVEPLDCFVDRLGVVEVDGVVRDVVVVGQADARLCVFCLSSGADGVSKLSAVCPAGRACVVDSTGTKWLGGECSSCLRVVVSSWLSCLSGELCGHSGGQGQETGNGDEDSGNWGGLKERLKERDDGGGLDRETEHPAASSGGGRRRSSSKQQAASSSRGADSGQHQESEKRDEENGYLGYLRAGGESGKVQSRGKENKKENRESCRVLLSFGASTRWGWGWRGEEGGGGGKPATLTRRGLGIGRWKLMDCERAAGSEQRAASSGQRAAGSGLAHCGHQTTKRAVSGRRAAGRGQWQHQWAPVEGQWRVEMHARGLEA